MTYFITLMKRSNNTYRAYLTINPVKEFKQANIRSCIQAKFKPLSIVAIFAETDIAKANIAMATIQSLTKYERDLLAKPDSKLEISCNALQKTYNNLRYTPLLLKQEYGIDLKELLTNDTKSEK